MQGMSRRASEITHWYLIPLRFLPGHIFRGFDIVISRRKMNKRALDFTKVIKRRGLFNKFYNCNESLIIRQKLLDHPDPQNDLVGELRFSTEKIGLLQETC